MSVGERVSEVAEAGEPARAPARLGLARRLWKAAPLPRGLRLAVSGAVYGLDEAVRRARAPKPEPEPPAELLPFRRLLPKRAAAIRPGPFVLSGYLSDVKGIGRGARLSLAAFRAGGRAPLAHDLRREPGGWGEVPSGGVWFCHANAPEAFRFLEACDGPRDCYRIAYWAWELPTLPPDWALAEAFFHEIWAPSRFVAEAIAGPARARGVRVVVAPHPLPDVGGVRAERARWGLADGVFAFLAMYDVNSSATRKNPMGAIRAFQAAFAPDRADVRLLVKVVAADAQPQSVAELARAIEGWPNIDLLCETLSDAEADALIASADAFVSLHRAEGFGLSIAQAMALARPVVATGWSGNLDFCQRGAILIPYRLVPVEDPTGVYQAPGQVWADPDLAAAAEALRRLADDPRAARRLGRAGRANVARRLPRRYTTRPWRRWLAS